MPPRPRTSDADSPPPETPAPSESVASAPSLRPASEASDPEVHRLLFERSATTDSVVLERIAGQLAELGYA